MKTKIQFDLGEFRCLKDEQPLTKRQERAQIERAKKEHSHIDYDKVISEFTKHYENAKPSQKENALSVLILAHRQQAAGFGKKTTTKY